jgi:hypothetical protein
MTLIANGVIGMLIGQEPPAPTSPSTSLWAVYLVVLGIIALQFGGIARSVRTIRGWRPTHCDAQQEPCASGSTWPCPSW